MYARILAPIDGSDTAQRGMQEAIRLAKEQGSQLRLLYVIDVHLAAIDPYGSVNVGELADALRNYGGDLLKKAQSAAAAQGVQAQTEIIESFTARAGDVIVGAARDWPADLIVMGTHGRRGVSHLLMGSDAEIVLRGTPVPVLLVRSSD